MKDFNDLKIDEYVLGILTAEEKAAMEKVIATDNEIAEEIRTRLALMEHLEAIEDQKMMAQVREIHQGEKAKRSKTVAFPRSRIIAIAAGLILLLGAGWWAWSTQQEIKPTDFYAANFEAYDLRFGSRDNEKDILQQAGGFYLDKNYKKAIPLFEQVLTEKPEEAKARFALAIAQMAEKDFKNAQLNLQFLIDNNDFLYANTAKWYLALSYLNENKIEAANQLLLEICADKQAGFSVKACNLNEKLN